MKAILTSLYCLPCVWTALVLISTMGVASFFMNTWVPFRGPIPSDGPVEGFASKQARIDFYDTSALRIRTAVRAGVIGGMTWIVGAVVSIVILSSLG